MNRWQNVALRGENRGGKRFVCGARVPREVPLPSQLDRRAEELSADRECVAGREAFGVVL